MDKESIYLLQCIDCNCNNCAFMQRDFATYNEWCLFHKELAQAEFDKAKAKLLQTGIKEEIAKANKMVFQFEKKFLLQYGHCTKLDKQVSFIPDTCQLHTQECFIHRKDYGGS